MKNNFKKRSLGILVATVAVSMPIVAAVSCGSEKETKKWEHKDEKFDKTIPWGKDIIAHEAIIENWHDGDTPKVKFTDPKMFKKPNISPAGIAKIRISLIDTPEIGTGGFGEKKYEDTTGAEFKYATAGKKLGEKLMPKGTKVWIVTDGSTTYDRIVGNIFYDSDKNGTYDSSWAVTIMAAGLAMPFVSNPDSVTDENNIVHYIGIPFADAYNYASTHKIGMFTNEDELDSILKTHGSTDVTSVKWHDSDAPTPNIYDYYKAWKSS